MQVTLGKEGSVTIIKPLGPIIAGELDALEGEIARLLKNWAKRLVLDLSEVPFLDSAGLEMLCRYQKELSNYGLQLKLCAATEMTHTILDLTRIGQRFQMFSDSTSAVRSFL